MKTVKLSRTNAINLILDWQEENVLDQEALASWTNRQLQDNLNENQSPEMGEVYQIKDTDKEFKVFFKKLKAELK